MSAPEDNVIEHIPSFCSGMERRRACADSLSELMAIDWIARWATEPNFTRWEVTPASEVKEHWTGKVIKDDACLMAIEDGGAKWWVVARLKQPELYGLPEWKAP